METYIDKLIGYIDETIAEANDFLASLGCDIDVVIEEQSTFDRLEVFREYYNKIIEKDDDKERFKVILNTLINLYDASKPEIFEKGWHNDRFPALLYLYGLFHNTIDDAKIRRAKLRLSQVLDGSVSTSDSFAAYEFIYIIVDLVADGHYNV